MANPYKGEVAFTAGNVSYKLSYSADALAELEEALGQTINELIPLMQNPKGFRLSMARTIFWAGLLDHQPGIDLPAARKIFRDLNAPYVLDLIGRAFALAFPVDEAGSGEASPQQPGGPSDGTGPASSTPGSASD